MVGVRHEGSSHLSGRKRAQELASTWGRRRADASSALADRRQPQGRLGGARGVRVAGTGPPWALPVLPEPRARGFHRVGAGRRVGCS